MTRAEYAEQRFKDSGTLVVNRIRQMADDIERELSAEEPRAERVIHHAMWGVANAGLEDLVRAERELQEARVLDV